MEAEDDADTDDATGLAGSVSSLHRSTHLAHLAPHSVYSHSHQAMEVNTRQSLYSPSATAHRRASLGEYPDK